MNQINFAALRKTYNPKLIGKSVKVLFIAESPPTKAEYYFYCSGRSPFSWSLMNALEIPHLKHWQERLKEFQYRGFYLIDATDVPIDKQDKKDRLKQIKSDEEKLRQEVSEIDPELIVILVKLNFELVRGILSKLKYKIANKDSIPFPLFPNQRKEFTKKIIESTSISS